ncbi:dTMP kinase [Candidatus Shapirobacteria bacterium]|nr:MAG: dTMP kinase [Candidatus Shapirobacteria bacterium]
MCESEKKWAVAVPDEAKFVVVEGIAGGGKTTVTKRIVDLWPGDVCVYREPGGTPFGEAIRKAVQSPDIPNVNERAAVLAYASARAQLVPEIRQKINNGTSVVLDRYWSTSWAFQGQKIPSLLVWGINMIATGGLLPDRWIFLGGDVETLLERKRRYLKAGGINDDRWDLLPDLVEFTKRSAKKYGELARLYPKRWRNIDATQPLDGVMGDVAKILLEIGIELRQSNT